MKRNVAFGILFASGDLSAAYAAADDDLDALAAGLHGSLDGLLHGSSEGNSLFECLSDALSGQLRIGLRSSQFYDVQDNALASELFQFVLQLIDAVAAAADDHTGLGGENVDPHLVLGSSFDDYLGYACQIQFLLDEFSDLVIFDKIIREVLLVRVPFGIPVFNNAHSESMRANFLTHNNLLLIIFPLKLRRCGCFS